MRKVFPLPIYSFIKISHQNGGVSKNKLWHALPWVLFNTLLEPLRLAELAIYNRSIKKHEIINPPIFILGYYRSGTTYLQQLLMQDDRFGHFSSFQMVFPRIILSSEKWLTPILEKLVQTMKIQDPVHRRPLTWNTPGEDDVAMTTSCNPRGAQWGFFFPNRMLSYFNKYVTFDRVQSSDISKWKSDYLYLLKKVSIANKSKQLILKSPPNTARIKLLLSMFPNAKFIYIHRNPYDVFSSNKRLWEVVQRVYSLRDSEYFDSDSIILHTYKEVIGRYLLDKSLIPKGQLTELRYETFIQDPIKSLKSVYASLNLKDFDHCEIGFNDYIAKQKQYKVLKHSLSPTEVKMISENWGMFMNYWNYPIL